MGVRLSSLLIVRPAEIRHDEDGVRGTGHVMRCRHALIGGTVAAFLR